MEQITIYTDGACKSNPGAGGWGVLILKNGKEIELCGGDLNTTNQRMELTAAIKALQYFKDSSNLLLLSDSKYVIQGITEWIINWKKNNWRNYAKKPVVNQDLWQQLDKLNVKHKVTWQWVKGHAGNDGNLKADRLANLGVSNLLNSSKLSDVV